MTNFVEKMMKTAEITINDMPNGLDDFEYTFWIDNEYPYFSAEKQLEIIKLIVNKCHTLNMYKGYSKDADFNIGAREEWSEYKYNGCNQDFTKALAQLTAELMKAGELDKEKVKGILEG